MMKKLILLTIIIIVAIITTYLGSQLKHEEGPLTKGSKSLLDLEAHWAAGNVVSLVRHTERCDRSDGPCVDGKDGITVLGKVEAIKIGKAYEKLPKHDTTNYNSPTKRTKQSADFMFPGKSVDKKWLRDGCKENLLEDIFKYKEEAKNLILVTHNTCIDTLGEHQGDKLIKIDLKADDTYGGSYFLVINKEKNKAYFLGYLLAGDWEKAYA
jgi:phosphohistidine phosphatase SixA